MKKTRDKIIIKVVVAVAVLGGAATFLNSIVETKVSAADDPVVNPVSVNIVTACTFTTTTLQHTATVTPGKFIGGIESDTVFTVGCNDPEGYVVYAVGTSDDVEGTTDMIGSGTAAGHNIPTGPAQNGDESNWSFKVHSASQGVTIQPSFDTDNYTAIPSSRTAIVKRTAGAADQDQFSVSYGLYVSNSQPAGMYTGKVLYVLFNPSSHSSKPDPKDYGDMQDFSCSLLADVGDTGFVTDSRDGNKYRIRKLADGKCWMVENLRLGGTTTITLTPSDSDVSANWTLPAGITSGFSNYTAAQINVAYKDTVVQGNSNNQKYGVYYNWCAATAGTCSSATSSGAIASGSVCPKGWHLPTSAEFSALYTAYGNNYTNMTNTSGPEFVLSGSFNFSSQNLQGSYGYFWSSTASGSRGAYYLSLNTSSVGPTSYDDRLGGNSVRCVFGE